ncbi:MAG: hypothetical protein JOZ08_25085 [Verrucomicrobia bacterium]|nr:hypothetical protein [Verrucomicrobiota bacterium]MBV8274729.1 hypothetical protein [Verrucomicrobiota bacterium]
MKARSIPVRVIAAFGVLAFQVLPSSPSLGAIQFPLTIIHAHLYVPMALAGQTKLHWWLVDTGSPWSLVNIEQAKQLVRLTPGISEQLTTVAGKDCKVLVNIRTFVDGYPVGQFDFFEASLNGMIAGNRFTGGRYGDSFEAGGVLGVNFLARYRALLNFRYQRLFFRAGTIQALAERAGFEREGYTYVPVQVTPLGRIEAIGSVGANSYSFLIDSGSPQTILQSTIEEGAWVFRWRSGNVYFALGQSARVSTGRLRGFKLGTQDVSGKTVQFATLPDLQTGFSHPLGGIIGEDFLWAYQAILDIGGGALYLKPAS